MGTKKTHPEIDGMSFFALNAEAYWPAICFSILLTSSGCESAGV